MLDCTRATLPPQTISLPDTGGKSGLPASERAGDGHTGVLWKNLPSLPAGAPALPARRQRMQGRDRWAAAAAPRDDHASSAGAISLHDAGRAHQKGRKAERRGQGGTRQQKLTFTAQLRGEHLCRKPSHLLTDRTP